MSARVVRAPRGTKLSCRSWLTEAPLRMLMNNLDPDVAEKPQELIVYGGTGKAARNWACFDAIVAALRRLGDDETLLVQSGKPVGVVQTHPDAPRVIIANANLVPKWATWEEFHRLEALGLTMFGQMTAGSWIYIGTQGILQGTYECFAAAANAHFGGDLAGKWILSAGLGGMGGAQPLAATMNGAAFLGIEVDPARIERRLATKYLDRRADSLDQALAMLDDARSRREAVSIGLCANAGDVYPELVRRGRIPDIVTEQTSAHDPLNGYVPRGLSLAEAADLRGRDAKEYVRRSRESIVAEVRAMLEMQRRGAKAFDYGNNIRAEAVAGGEAHAFDIIGFVPLYIRPLFCQGKGPFRWAALSGDPEDIKATDEAVRETVPADKALHRWLDLAAERVAFQGLPARICWLGLGDRAEAGLRFNDLVRSGRVKAPIVIGRDHLDCGSVASPNRETEGMKDGSDAIADWPILNLVSNAVCGATWVSFHHGGGVGMGYALHAGMVVVADGTDAAAARLQRVLTSDPLTGIYRHIDAGYDEAIAYAKDNNVEVPMRR